MITNGWEYEIQRNKLYLLSKVKNRKAFRKVRKYFKNTIRNKKVCKYAKIYDESVKNEILNFFIENKNEKNSILPKSSRTKKVLLEKDVFCKGCKLCPEGEDSSKCSLLKAYNLNRFSFNKCTHPYFVEIRCIHSKLEKDGSIYCVLLKEKCKATYEIPYTGEKFIRFNVCEHQKPRENLIPYALIGMK
jgi:hypothetical protein